MLAVGIGGNYNKIMLKQTIIEILLDEPLLTEKQIKQRLREIDYHPRNGLLVEAMISDMLYDGELYKTMSGGIIVPSNRIRR